MRTLIWCWVLVLVSGCAMTSEMKLENGLLIQEVGQTNLFRPSNSVLRVSECVREPNRTQVVMIDGHEEVCHGRWMPVALVQGTQPGSLTGVFGAMIQGGAIVGGAYLLADGIGESGSTTNVEQEGGGAEANGGTANAGSLSSNMNNNAAQASSLATGGAVSNHNANTQGYTKRRY